MSDHRFVWMELNEEEVYRELKKRHILFLIDAFQRELDNGDLSMACDFISPDLIENLSAPISDLEKGLVADIFEELETMLDEV